MGSYLKIILELGKVRISLPVALSSLTGYLMYKGGFDRASGFLALGIFLVSCGSSAFNHFQEREMDALMPRTKNRPIPSGRISPAGAFWVAMGYTLLGFASLYVFLPPIALLLSAFTWPPITLFTPH